MFDLTAKCTRDCLNVVSYHLGGVTLAVKKDKASDPAGVSLLGAESEETEADDRAHLLQ